MLLLKKDVMVVWESKLTFRSDELEINTFYNKWVSTINKRARITRWKRDVFGVTYISRIFNIEYELMSKILVIVK